MAQLIRTRDSIQRTKPTERDAVERKGFYIEWVLYWNDVCVKSNSTVNYGTSKTTTKKVKKIRKKNNKTLF